MSTTLRYGSFAAALVAAVAVAVAVLGAQVGRQDQSPRNRGDRPLMLLDGGGSRLGVMVRDLGPDEASSAPQGGVKIDSVEEDSPAARAGLEAGDVVVEYDGERVRGARQFTRLVLETPEGRAVPVGVLRNGKRETLSATPEARRFGWDMSIDGDRIRRELGRGLREFRFNPPALDFGFDGIERMPGLGGRGRMGVTLDPLSEQLAAYFGAKDGGALVSSVRPDSPADKAGLKAGDVITAVNGEHVRDAGDVVDEISRTGSGEFAIEYLRERQAAKTQVTIPPRENGPARRPVRPAGFMRPA